MDVQKIQKINDLALKLQQQGGFEREEAVKQAEQMLSKNNNLEVNEISNQTVEEMDQKPKTNITWQEAMEKNTKFIVSTFKDIQKEQQEKYISAHLMESPEERMSQIERWLKCSVGRYLVIQHLLDNVNLIEGKYRQ